MVERITYDVGIEGVTPLLFNRFIEASINTKVKRRAGSTKEVNIEDKLYKDGKKKICIPSTYFRGALVDASKSFKIVGKGKSTYSKLVGSSVEVTPELILLKEQKFEPYSIAAVNPMTRGRVMTTRPRFNKWSCEFSLVFNPDDIPIEVIKNILDYAGEYTGVGDWRPQKKGSFGKFIVSKFKEAKK